MTDTPSPEHKPPRSRPEGPWVVVGLVVAAIAMVLFVLYVMPGFFPATSASPTPSVSPSETPTPTPDETPTPTPTATPTPTSAECANGAVLPEGVDPRACSLPEVATQPIPEHPEFPGLYILVSPDGTTRCDVSWDSGYAACAVTTELPPGDPAEVCDAGDWDNNFVYLVEGEDGQWAAGQGSCRNDPLMAELGDPPVLPAGAVLTSGELAVLMGDGEITVWHGTAGHGFRIYPDGVQRW